MTAHYRCIDGATGNGCGYEWQQKPKYDASCPRCGNVWLKWVNYGCG